MKTLFIGCGVLLLLLVLSIGACTYTLAKAVANQPLDAKRETLFVANRSLIEGIDKAIRESATLAACSERLRVEISDPRILWLQLRESGGTQQLDVVKRESWNGTSTVIINGAGSGTLAGKFGTREIRIIQSQERSSAGPVFEYTIYLAAGQPMPAAPVPAAPAKPEQVEKP